MERRHPIDRLDTSHFNLCIKHSNGVATHFVSAADIISGKAVLNTETGTTHYLTVGEDRTTIDVTPKDHAWLTAWAKGIACPQV